MKIQKFKFNVEVTVESFDEDNFKFTRAEILKEIKDLIGKARMTTLGKKSKEVSINKIT